MAVDDPGAPFKWIGGKLCLDFINTVSGRFPRPGGAGRNYADVIEQERLVSFSDLVRWGRAADVLSAGQATTLRRVAHAAPGKATLVVARARAVREAMYRLFVAVGRGWPPEVADREALNRELARARTHERLVPDAPRFGWAWDTDARALDRVLWPVVRSAAELLVSDDLKRVRRCDGEECRWLFFDTSRNRSRRWCDMAECGNLAKVRRYRLRQ